MSTFRSFFERIIGFFCALNNRSFRFVFKMEKKKQIFRFLILTNTNYFFKFRFCFYLFLQKVRTNYVFAFGYLISSESKLYLLRFYDWAKKTICFVSVKFFVFLNKRLYSSFDQNFYIFERFRFVCFRICSISKLYYLK